MTADKPGVIAPPGVIFLAAFIAGYFGRNLVPGYQSFPIGIGLGVAGALLLAWGAATMLRARTHIDPYKPATTVVTTGPYRFTRNPLYLSVNILYVALCVVLGLTSSLVLLPVANVVLLYGVIKREERYLEAKFGDAYRVYRSTVRRWL